MRLRGLNHLGWVRRVTVRGKDVTAQLLQNPEYLRKLYHANLFDPLLDSDAAIDSLGIFIFLLQPAKSLPQPVARGRQPWRRTVAMNKDLFGQLQSQAPREALNTYRRYLMQRNSSYMRLEAEAGSAFARDRDKNDPFETGHRLPPHRDRCDERFALR